MPKKKLSQPPKSTLAKKLNVTLLFIFCSGMVISSITLAILISYEAYKQTLSKAFLVMSSLDAVQYYTAKEVRPQVQKRLKKQEILMQTIPDYAARKVFERMYTSDPIHNDFYYKYAMLNPKMNQAQTDEFETNIIDKLIQNRTVKQLEGFRAIHDQYFFYVARPLTIAKLKSNSLSREIVGTQIVYIPIIKPLKNYGLLFAQLWGVVTLILIITMLSISFWLRTSVIKPVKKIAQVAEAVSNGDMSAEFDQAYNDEIENLLESFNRMKMSLAIAIEKFEKYRIKSSKSNNSTSLKSDNIRPRFKE